MEERLCVCSTLGHARRGRGVGRWEMVAWGDGGRRTVRKRGLNRDEVCRGIEETQTAAGTRDGRAWCYVRVRVRGWRGHLLAFGRAETRSRRFSFEPLLFSFLG
jgi:hypothetical protein